MTLCDFCRKANRSCEAYPLETLTCVEYQVDPKHTKAAALALAETARVTEGAQSRAAFAALVRTLESGS
mgnify:CR=1 FL=1